MNTQESLAREVESCGVQIKALEELQAHTTQMISTLEEQREHALQAIRDLDEAKNKAIATPIVTCTYCGTETSNNYISGSVLGTKFCSEDCAHSYQETANHLVYANDADAWPEERAIYEEHTEPETEKSNTGEWEW